MSRIFPRLPPGHIFKSTSIICGCGTALFMIVDFFHGDELFFKNMLMPVVHRFMDCEAAHQWALRMYKYGFFPQFGDNYREFKELECTAFGKFFNNPIGLAAGFDKDGSAISSLRKSGFGFIEIGTVTPLPQEGNPKPRIFRLIEDEAVINRYGFNSCGVGPVFARIKKSYESNSSVPLGVNIGKNKATKEAWIDYNIGANYFGSCCDYLVVNISSPNTPGLRNLQMKEELQNLMFHVKSTIGNLGEDVAKPKILLKIAPDLSASEKHDIANISLDKRYGIDGLIISNSTIARPLHLKSEFKIEDGGLSGKPLKSISTEVIRHMYSLTKGKVPIIGCGGVSSGEDAYEKIRAGASLLQLYTSLIYQGFPVIGKIKRELVFCLKRDGFQNVSDAVGADHYPNIGLNSSNVATS